MRTHLTIPFLLLLALFAMTANAQRVSNPSLPQFSYVQERITGGGDCDTIAAGYPIPGSPVLYASNEWGFVSGHNNYGDLAFAERFANPGGITQVFGIRFGFGWASSSGPNAKVIARVWSETAGKPGSVLQSADLRIDDIIAASGNNTVMFPSPVAVSGPFYVGYEVTYNPGDTVAVFTTRDSTVYPSTGWSKFSDGNWFPFDDPSNSWNLALAQAIYPVVITGTFPVTILPANPSIGSGGQVQLTASGGINHTWSPAAGLSCTNCANPIASPIATTTYNVTAWDSTQTCAVTEQVTVMVIGVGVEEEALEGSMRIYPNPAVHRVFLDFCQTKKTNLYISLVNSMGQVVYQALLNGLVGDYHGEIDVRHLTRGMYTIKISDGRRSSVRKLVVE
jgi:hypothetical protein